MYSPAPGRIEVAARGTDIFHCCFIRSTSTVITDFFCHLIVLVVVGVLHVRCIPQQNLQRQF